MQGELDLSSHPVLRERVHAVGDGSARVALWSIADGAPPTRMMAPTGVDQLRRPDRDAVGAP